jgi:hypothetical protein
MRRALCVGLIQAAVFGCDPSHFTGENHELEFDSNLSHDVAYWRPATLLAVGSRPRFNVITEGTIFTLHLFCDDEEDCPDDTWWVGVQSFSADDDAVFSTTGGSTHRDLLTGEVVGPGSTRIICTGTYGSTVDPCDECGPIEDHFDVEARTATAVRFNDPLLTYLHYYARLPLGITQGEEWRAPGTPVALAAGGPLLSLEIDLLDDAGDSLAYGVDPEGVGSDVAVRPPADPRLAVFGHGAFVHLWADPTSQGRVIDVPVALRDVELGRVAVEVMAPDAAVQLAVAVVAGPWEDGPFGIKATAYLADGRPLLQAPVEWEIPEDVIVTVRRGQCYGNCQPGPSNGADAQPARLDMLEIQGWVSTVSEEETVPRTIVARVGDLTAEVTLDLFPTPPPPPRPAPDDGCSCGSSRADWQSAMALSLPLLFWSRRRDRPRGASTR